MLILKLLKSHFNEIINEFTSCEFKLYFVSLLEIRSLVLVSTGFVNAEMWRAASREIGNVVSSNLSFNSKPYFQNSY